MPRLFISHVAVVVLATSFGCGRSPDITPTPGNAAGRADIAPAISSEPLPGKRQAAQAADSASASAERTASSRSPGDQELVLVTAHDLFYAYQTDSNTANQRYKGKIVYLAGYVDVLAADFIPSSAARRVGREVSSPERPYITMV